MPEQENQTINQVEEDVICPIKGCGEVVETNWDNIDADNGLRYCQGHIVKCYECKENHNTDNIKYHGNYDYCEDCFNDNFMMCPNCEEVIDNKDYLKPTPRNRNRNSMVNGGCTECCEKCASCGKVIDKEDNPYYFNGDNYCEDCYCDKFGNCEACSEVYAQDELIYIEDAGSFCDSCYNEKFVKCEKCSETIELNDAVKLNDSEYYCEKCYEPIAKEHYNEYTENFNTLDYTKKDRFLNLLNKLLPIQVKDLKTKHPTIANGLTDLIAFSGGKLLTNEVVDNYRKTLLPEKFEAKYTLWDSDLQRSISNLQNVDESLKKPQLVINVLASSEMLNKMNAEPAFYDLFGKINDLSRQSGHPYVKNQIGWARVELDPNKEYILVDEIQSDHSNAVFKIQKNRYQEDIAKIRSALIKKYNLTDEGLNKLLDEYSDLLKDFPNIASQAVSKFAQANNFKKIYWHTYESGRKLKDNKPPKSLYTGVPKENFFTPSQDKPFGLEGEFLEREANKTYKMIKLASKLYLKYLK